MNPPESTPDSVVDSMGLGLRSGVLVLAVSRLHWPGFDPFDSKIGNLRCLPGLARTYCAECYAETA